MNYIIMPAGEPIMCEYPEYDYVRRYLTGGIPEFGEIYEPRYERFPSVHTMEASYFLSGAEARLMNIQAQVEKKAYRDAGHMARTVYQPMMLFSNYCKEVNSENKMDSDTKKRLSKYIELFEEIFKKIENESVAVTLLTEISKDRRSEQMKNERQTKNSDAVTFKQKKCMQNLGIEYPENITRKEASVLIQEEIERLNGAGE